VAQVMTLSAVAALSVAGAGLGVQLGRSAIAEINPIYYSAPPSSSRFYADLTPNHYIAAAWQAPQSADYWSTDLDANGRAPCSDCAENFVDELYSAMNEPRFAPPAVRPAEPSRQLAPNELDRYMSFPVTQDEARRANAYDQSLARSDQPLAEPRREEAEGQPQGM
jgi:hypothetical protein